MTDDPRFVFQISEDEKPRLTDTQTGQITLRGQIHAARVEADLLKAVVYVDLSKTVVSAVTADDSGEPAQMAWHDSEHQGYFVEAVTVRMNAVTQDGVAMEVQDNSPATTPATATVGSSVSYSLGADQNASVGFFGADPTGSVSAGVHEGISWGSSYQSKIQDYRVENQSSGTEVVHFYLLGMYEGGAYEDHTSLHHNDLSTLSFSGIDLVHAVTRSSISDIPIPSQAVFALPEVADLRELTIRVSVEVTYRQVSAELSGFLDSQIIWKTGAVTATVPATKILYPA